MSFNETWNALRPVVRSAVAGATIAGALGGAIVAVPPAWVMLGWAVPASQAYVQQHVQAEIGKIKPVLDSTSKTTFDTQIELAEGKREASEESLSKWSIELTKATDPQTQGLIRMRIRELEETRRKLDMQLSGLYSSRNAR